MLPAVRGTQSVLRAAAASKDTVRRVVLTGSSTGVYVYSAAKLPDPAAATPPATAFSRRQSAVQLHNGDGFDVTGVDGADMTGVGASDVTVLMQRLSMTDASTRHQSMGSPTARRTGCQNLWPRTPEQRCV